MKCDIEMQNNTHWNFKFFFYYFIFIGRALLGPLGLRLYYVSILNLYFQVLLTYGVCFQAKGDFILKCEGKNNPIAQLLFKGTK